MSPPPEEHRQDMLGDYRLIAKLGSGGMGEVLLGAATGRLGTRAIKLVVIKRLRDTLADDPDFVSMLVEEARITAKMLHPNLVQVYELGEFRGEHFLVMEFLEGQSFHSIRRRASQMHVSIPLEGQLSVFCEVLAGLEYAHDLVGHDGAPLGIVHRDISPQNIFLTYDGHVKLLDFGIARALDRASSTMVGVVKGKIRYMAPEQARGGPLDARTDLFAVGLMLWECVTGKRYWGTLDDHAIMSRLARGDEPRSPREVLPDISPELDALCRKVLAPEPEDRHQSAAELRRDLEAIIGDTAVLARRQLHTLHGQLFARERTRLKQQISTSVAAWREESEPAVPYEAVSHAAQPVALEVAASSDDDLTVLDERRPPGARRFLVALAAALAAAGLVASLLFVVRTRGHGTPTARARNTPTRDRTSQSAAARSSAPHLVEEDVALARPAAQGRQAPPKTRWLRKDRRPSAARAGGAEATTAPANRLNVDTKDPWEGR